MWFLFRILEKQESQIEVWHIGDIFNNTAYLLTLNANSGALRRNAVHCPESRKSVVKKAWAMFSGRTNLKREVSTPRNQCQRKKGGSPDLTYCTGLWG